MSLSEIVYIRLSNRNLFPKRSTHISSGFLVTFNRISGGKLEKYFVLFPICNRLESSENSHKYQVRSRLLTEHTDSSSLFLALVLIVFIFKEKHAWGACDLFCFILKNFALHRSDLLIAAWLSDTSIVMHLCNVWYSTGICREQQDAQIKLFKREIIDYQGIEDSQL